MEAPRTLDTVERRWERRIYCVTLFPLIALGLMVFATWHSLSESREAMIEYWRR